MKPYVDYEYYCESYSGEIVSQDSFDRIVRKASVFIRDITFDRVNPDCAPDEVKDSVCAVCDVIQTDETRIAETGGIDIKSETTDGYSVTYATEGKDGQSHEEILKNKMYAAARIYLRHTGLLYLGVLR